MARRARAAADPEAQLRECQAHVAALERELDAARAELAQAREQQAATSGVLRVISRSATDLQAVLDTIVESAVRLCSSDGAVVFRVEGDTYRSVARSSELGSDAGRVTLSAPGPANPLSWEEGLAGRAMLDGEVVHVHDLAAVP
ncbi:MAG TPA: GAF domain-containing protein, partial [Chloroflexota bacterium]